MGYAASMSWHTSVVALLVLNQLFDMRCACPCLFCVMSFILFGVILYWYMVMSNVLTMRQDQFERITPHGPGYGNPQGKQATQAQTNTKALWHHNTTKRACVCVCVCGLETQHSNNNTQHLQVLQAQQQCRFTVVVCCASVCSDVCVPLCPLTGQLIIMILLLTTLLHYLISCMSNYPQHGVPHSKHGKTIPHSSSHSQK